MVHSLGNDHLRQQARACRALLNRLWRLGGRLYRACTRILPAHVLDDRQFRGNVFVALAALFTNRPQILPARSAVLFRILQIMHDALTLEMARKRLPTACPFLW